MAAPMLKTRERKNTERQNKLIVLIRASMRLGNSTKKDIALSAGIKIWQLNDMLVLDKDLQAEFSIMRRTLVDIAADNMQEILEDRNHPQNFQATKYILDNYKSDLDSNLEAKDSGEIGLTIGGAGKDSPSPVRITFGTKKL
jgi:hypothetical protein